MNRIRLGTVCRCVISCLSARVSADLYYRPQLKFTLFSVRFAFTFRALVEIYARVHGYVILRIHLIGTNFASKLNRIFTLRA